MARQGIVMGVNGKSYKITVDLHRTLSEVLRDELGLTGAKYCCGQGECGAWSVLVDDKPILSCLTLAIAMDGKEITPIEGLAKDDSFIPLNKLLSITVPSSVGSAHRE